MSAALASPPDRLGGHRCVSSTSRLLLMAATLCLLPAPGTARETQPGRSGSLTVRITAPGASGGEIGCALYASAAGFPLDLPRSVARQSHPAREAVTCRFDGLAAGTYAVAVSHDANGNGKTDRNLVGIPKEAWGVSNNVRPSMRAPRFDEAAVKVDGAMEITIEVKR